MRRVAGFVVVLAAVTLALSTARGETPVVHVGPSPPAAPPGQTEVKGDAAIMAGYADLFARDTVTVNFDEAHWIEVPPLVVSWGLTTLTLHPKDGGSDVISQTRFTDAAVKIDGGWRYVVDHASKPER